MIIVFLLLLLHVDTWYRQILLYILVDVCCSYVSRGFPLLHCHFIIKKKFYSTRWIALALEEVGGLPMFAESPEVGQLLSSVLQVVSLGSTI